MDPSPPHMNDVIYKMLHDEEVMRALQPSLSKQIGECSKVAGGIQNKVVVDKEVQVNKNHQLMGVIPLIQHYDSSFMEY